MTTRVKRINKELKHLASNRPEYLHSIDPRVSDDRSRVVVAIVGPANTPYEGGKFVVSLTCPSDYPFRSPSVRVMTPILHYQIKIGVPVHNDLLQQNWAPSKQLRNVLDFIYGMLIASHIGRDDECRCIKMRSSSGAAFNNHREIMIEARQCTLSNAMCDDATLEQLMHAAMSDDIAVAQPAAASDASATHIVDQS